MGAGVGRGPGDPEASGLGVCVMGSHESAVFLSVRGSTL